LYYAEYSFSTTGCTVVAFDLEKGKELWRTKLMALGSIAHSQYLNRAAIDVNKQNVIVRGNESLGKYMEYLDVKTGATVGHEVFEYPGQPK
jgi:outer membrane protein assembly factor BamB